MQSNYVEAHDLGLTDVAGRVGRTDRDRVRQTLAAPRLGLHGEGGGAGLEGGLVEAAFEPGSSLGTERDLDLDRLVPRLRLSPGLRRELRYRRLGIPLGRHDGG